MNGAPSNVLLNQKHAFWGASVPCITSLFFESLPFSPIDVWIVDQREKKSKIKLEIISQSSVISWWEVERCMPQIKIITLTVVSIFFIRLLLKIVEGLWDSHAIINSLRALHAKYSWKSCERVLHRDNLSHRHHVLKTTKSQMKDVLWIEIAFFR